MKILFTTDDTNSTDLKFKVCMQSSSDVVKKGSAIDLIRVIREIRG